MTVATAHSDGRATLPGATRRPPEAIAVTARTSVAERASRSNRVLLLVATALLFAIPSTTVLRGLKSVGMPTQLLGWLALVSWIGGRVRGDGRLATSSQPLRPLFGVLAAGALVSYGLATARPLLPLELGNADRLGYVLAAGTGLALLLADGLPEPHDVFRIRNVLLAGGYFSATIGLVQRFAHFDLVKQIAKIPLLTQNNGDFGVAQFQTDIFRGFRAYGTADHAIEFAVVSSALVPLALHAFYTATTRHQREYHAIGAALLAVGSLISLSRSGVVGLAAGVLVYAVTLPKRRFLNLVAASVGLIVLLQVFAHGVVSTLRYLIFAGNSDPSVAHRTGDIPYITPLLQHHMWAGIGFGTFQPQVYRFLDNEYLVTLVQSGIIGMSLLVFLFLFSAWLASRARHTMTSPAARDMAQAVAAGVVVLGVSAAFYDELAFRQSAYLLFIFVGLSGALWRFARAL